MGTAQRCHPGDWVEIESVLLEPSERAAGLPSETADTPLRTWVKGFAGAEAAIGEAVTVETMTGRRVTGRLTAVNPGYDHTFGDAPPELSRVGVELRELLVAYRKAGAR